MRLKVVYYIVINYTVRILPVAETVRSAISAGGHEALDVAEELTAAVVKPGIEAAQRQTLKCLNASVFTDLWPMCILTL